MSPYRDVDAMKAEGFAVTAACAAAEVSGSAYYDWTHVEAGPSDAVVAEAHLANEMHDAHRDLDGTDGRITMCPARRWNFRQSEDETRGRSSPYRRSRRLKDTTTANQAHESGSEPGSRSGEPPRRRRCSTACGIVGDVRAGFCATRPVRRLRRGAGRRGRSACRSACRAAEAGALVRTVDQRVGHAHKVP